MKILFMKTGKRKNDFYKILLLSGALAGLILFRILIPAGASPVPAGGAPEEPPQETASEIIKVNINTGSIEDLMTLPGIGEKTARNIMVWREKEGPFKSPEDLLDVKGIGTKKFKKLEPFIVLH